jgi:hypothetical protein
MIQDVVADSGRVGSLTFFAGIAVAKGTMTGGYS